LKFSLEDKLKDFPPILTRNYTNLKNNTNRSLNEFRVMQWNILARALCQPDEMNKAPEETFDWSKFRLWRTIQELVRFKSDLICIEEADVYEEIKPYLHSIGYTSIFCPKFDSPCLQMLNNVGPDGLAIFYRLSVFQIVNMSCEKVILNDEINSQVFIILKLKHKPTEKYLHLVCLHLKAKDKYHEKRHEQIKHILNTLKKHLKGTINSLRTHPVLICGDFNGEPFENFYTELIHDEEIKLEDAYTFDSAPKEPTTIKLRAEKGSMLKRAIDYIFYNPKGLKLTGYFELPKENSLIEEQGLPNLTHSSDHLSLIADFKFLNEIF